MEQSELIKAVEEARVENMVLQTVCAALMAEVAALTEDPRSTLDRMVASLHGLTFGVGQSGGQPHMAKTVEQICQMAEDSLPNNNLPEDE